MNISRLCGVKAWAPWAAALMVALHLACSSSRGSPAGETGQAGPSSQQDSGGIDSAVSVDDDGGDADSTTSTTPDGAAGLSLTWNVIVQSPVLGSGEADAGDAGDAAAPAQPVSGVVACVAQMASIPCATTD